MTQRPIAERDVPSRPPPDRGAGAVTTGLTTLPTAVTVVVGPSRTGPPSVGCSTPGRNDHDPRPALIGPRRPSGSRLASRSRETVIWDLPSRTRRAQRR